MKFLYALILFLSPMLLSAQQANHWYFGVNAGIDFSSGTATAVYGGALNASGGTASISDSTGNLLFYTDGLTVWNRYHQIMPNGNGTLGGGFGSQPVVVVPDPGNASRYYIFTTDGAGGSAGLRYSTVDISLLSDSGDVTMSNALLVTPVVDKVTATRHANGTDYWVVTHLFGSDAFYAQQVTAAGLGTIQLSTIGIVHDTSSIGNSFGQIKISPCGDKLAIAAGYKDTVELLDFDAATGAVSNPVSIPFTDHVFGVEFSPDASRLYVSNYNPDTSLVQFDLTLATPAAIIASRYGYLTSSQVFGLQLGPDSNIYVARSFIQFVGVINDPNSLGAAANFAEMGLDLDPLGTGLTQGGLGLTGFMQGFLPSENCGPTSIPEVRGDQTWIWWENPSSDNVTFHSVKPCFVKVYNSIGELVVERKLVSDENILLKTGVYFVVLEKDGKQNTAKLIVVE